MADIIPFRSRAQLEWEEWLEFEDRLREAILKNDERTSEMTEQEIIEDVKQRLTDKEIQGVKEIAALLDHNLGKK
ncbi:hypothetical protein [Virgibacillus sediminis]|uniref:Uncharacterized protein n=1 Tax=Virgibacillus sediminis TaxID=202260 RepID=A0ABV7A3X4_9BACI